MEITGTIEYKITISDNGEIEVEYIPKIEDELASLCISQKTIDSYTWYLNEERKKHSGKNKRAITDVLNDVMKSKLGLNHVVDFMVNNYKAYQEHLKLSAEPKFVVKQEPMTIKDIEDLKERGIIK